MKQFVQRRNLIKALSESIYLPQGHRLDYIVQADFAFVSTDSGLLVDLAELGKNVKKSSKKEPLWTYHFVSFLYLSCVFTPATLSYLISGVYYARCAESNSGVTSF